LETFQALAYKISENKLQGKKKHLFLKHIYPDPRPEKQAV